MDISSNLKHINIIEKVKQKFQYAASMPLSEFTRLELCSSEQSTLLYFKFEFFEDYNQNRILQPWLHLVVETELDLICQRCMEPMRYPIQFESKFRFVTTEKEAEKDDEKAEEDVLVLSSHFNLLSLIEDELLLNSPYAPRHEQCEKQLKLSSSDADYQKALKEKKNPFDMLKKLK